MSKLSLKNSKLSSSFSRYGGILIVLALFFSVYAIFTDTFLTVSNIVLILRQAATSLLMAFGLTIVFAAGSFDQSLGSVYGLTGMLAGLWAIAGMSIPMILLLTSLVAVAFGLLNGLLITNTAVPAFIVTLGTQFIAKGISYLSAQGRNYAVVRDDFNYIGTGIIAELPIQIYYALFLFIVLSILLNQTKTGRHIQATGSNATAAQFAGIQTVRIKIFVHVLCSLMAGFAGVTNTARLFNASPANELNSIDPICAVVIGGTSMAGGNGTLIGTVFGALVMTVMANGLNHMGISPYWQQVIKGVLIIAAVALDGFKREKEQKQITRAIIKGEEEEA